MEEEFKVVAAFADQFSAEVTAGLLRDNGIPAQIFRQTSTFPCINAALNSVEVKVNAEDYEAAKALLDAPPAEPVGE